MTPPGYAELVKWIEDRWGPSEAWGQAHHLVGDFAELDADAVWESAKTRMTSAPEKAQWPPKPAELVASALDRMRQKPQLALPETTERFGWSEYSMRAYGEVISLREAVERAAANA